MRRRKQKNPLLMRIIVISILFHIALLPVLAHFGAFKKIQQSFIVGEVKMVNLPTPPTTKPPEAKKVAKTQKPAQTAKKASATTPHQQRAAQATNLNHPQLALATGGGGDSTGGGVEQGSGKAGDLPTEKTNTTQPTIKADPMPEPKPDPKPEPKPDPKPEPKPIVKVTTPKPEPMPEPMPEPKPTPAPHVPVFTQVAQTFAPQPTIPDELRAQAIDKTVIVEITVDENGNTTNVKLTQSTGNDDLDRIAIDTPRKWKFRPATRDGQPVESKVRLHVEFQVN